LDTAVGYTIDRLVFARPPVGHQLTRVAALGRNKPADA
jgi:hypothetical protein